MNLRQQIKRTLTRSKLSIWKKSTPLKWNYQPSNNKNILIFWILIIKQKRLAKIKKHSKIKLPLSQIQQFIHKQHRIQMLNLNKYSHIGSTLHWDPTIRRPSWTRNWRPLLPSTKIQLSQKYLPWQAPWTHSMSKQFAQKKLSVSYVLQRMCEGKYIIFTRTHIIKFTRNVCAWTYYSHTSKYNRINKKQVWVTSPLYVHARPYYHNCHNWIPILTYISHMLIQFRV